MSRLILLGAVLGIVVSLSVGLLTTFTTADRGGGSYHTVQCESPYHGAGQGLTGTARTACEEEAKTRATVAGLVALGFLLGGVVLAYVFKPRY